MMAATLLEQMKRNNIIEQLKELNITVYKGKEIHQMVYPEMIRALTMTKLTLDEDVRIESSENEWF